MARSAKNPYERVVSDMAKAAGESVVGQGVDWIAVDSKTLGEVVVWAARDCPMVPAKYKDCVVYQWPEIGLLRGMSRDTLRHIHNIKRLFGGADLEEDSETYHVPRGAF